MAIAYSGAGETYGLKSDPFLIKIQSSVSQEAKLSNAAFILRISDLLAVQSFSIISLKLKMVFGI